MADYYTHFSVVLPLPPEGQAYALGLVQQVLAYRNDNRQLPVAFPASLRELVEDWPFETAPVKSGVWLHSQCGGQDTACRFIQHLLQRFDFAPFVAFEWSHDCSQPRTDAYGGGAAFVTDAEIETFSTSEWLRKLQG